MLQQLLARWRPWAEALAGMDDPQGEYLLALDERVRRLEDVVVNLRTPLPADAAVDVTSAPGIGRELIPPSNQRGIK
jgi:hypothetical protein